MHSANWDNLRFVLAVADQGSVSEAARVLGVNHATVLRRVAAFEEAQGGPVFEKTATGYRILAERVRVIEAAREVQNAHLTVERLMHGASGSVRGVVRVSSTDTLCSIILPGLVARVQETSPDLRVEVLANNSHLDFSRLQADISIRPAVSLPDDMVGETPAELAFRAYAAPGAPPVWLGLAGPIARSLPAAWMAENLKPDQIGVRSDSFLVLREMARLGLGIAVLPCFCAKGVAELSPLDHAMPRMAVPLWVATHVELRDAPRIRLVRRYIVEHLVAQADLLACRT